MDTVQEKAIRGIVNSAIKNFAEGFEAKHTGEVENPTGVINSKKNNCFISVLGDEFIFYSALVRSFDSSFGNVLENIGNEVAKFSYKTSREIHSYMLPEQTSYISSILDKYEIHELTPALEHYTRFYYLKPDNVESFRTKHVCDNWFYDEANKTHYLVELKAGGDLDIKKAKAEKLALLKEYFMLKNNTPEEQKIKVFFATAYNKFGEGEEWHQSSVETYFAREELLIGKDYWNFVCNDNDGFNIIFDQYKQSSEHIKQALIRIRELYHI